MVNLKYSMNLQIKTYMGVIYRHETNIFSSQGERVENDSSLVPPNFVLLYAYTRTDYTGKHQFPPWNNFVKNWKQGYKLNVWIICWYHPPFGWCHLILQFNGQKPKSGGGPNQPQYKTTIEIWHNGTNLSAWQTYTPLEDGPGNGQRSYFFTFWNLQLSSIVLFLPLMVQNYHPLTIQTNNGQDLRMPQTQSTRQDIQARFISQIKTVHNTQQTVASGREKNCVPCMFC
jgi:hypothetical protein